MVAETHALVDSSGAHIDIGQPSVNRIGKGLQGPRGTNLGTLSAQNAPSFTRLDKRSERLIETITESVDLDTVVGTNIATSKAASAGFCELFLGQGPRRSQPNTRQHARRGACPTSGQTDRSREHSSDQRPSTHTAIAADLGVRACRHLGFFRHLNGA